LHHQRPVAQEAKSPTISKDELPSRGDLDRDGLDALREQPGGGRPLASDEVPVSPAEASGDTGRTRTIAEDIDGDGAPALPSILLAGVGIAIWLVTWLAGRRWRRWPAYLIGVPTFLIALFLFFEEFSRVLPSNY